MTRFLDPFSRSKPRDKILLEAKAIESLTSSHIKQVLNYLAASRLKLGLLVNFGEDSPTYKSVVL